MKRVFSVFLAVAFLFGTLVGCNSVDTTVRLDDTPDIERTGIINIELNEFQIQTSKVNYVSKAVELYKKQYPNVKVEIKEHMTKGREYYTGLSARIMAGDGPDIILHDYLHWNDINKTQAAGVYEDLRYFMENDKTFKREDYNTAVLDGSRFGDKQYFMPISYKIPMFVTTQANLNESGIKLENCDTSLDMLQEFSSYWLRNKDNPDAPHLITGLSNFFRAASYSGVDLFEFSKGKTNLDDPKMLELLNNVFEQLKIIYPYERTIDTPVYIFTNPYPALTELEAKRFATCFDLFSYGGYLSAVQVFSLEDTPVFFPWRDENGGIQAVAFDGLLINSASENKQNAWNFIKLALSEEAQHCSYPQTGLNMSNFGIPVNKAALEVKENTFYKTSTDLTDGTTLKPVKQEYIDKFIKLQDDISGVIFPYPEDADQINIMFKYVVGKESYEECLGMLKDRLEIYVSE